MSRQQKHDAEWEKRAAKAEAALQHIAEYPNITATAMRDCARETLRAAGVDLKPREGDGAGSATDPELRDAGPTGGAPKTDSKP